MNMKTNYLLVITLCCSALLSGCMTPGKNMIPQGGSMTMSQIYQEETSGQMSANGQKQSMHSLPSIRNAVIGPTPQTNYVGYTATATTETNNLFKQLPNPEIPLYIYPHMVQVGGESYPKPGMSTAFFLYDKNHFAMPNEVY